MSQKLNLILLTVAVALFDGGSAEEKSVVFNRYNGSINNYLSAEGYALKQAGQDWNERLKAREVAK
jgi:hypothetical protein